MKIWIDLRFFGDDLYSKFISQLIEWLIAKKTQYKYVIYANWSKDNLEQKHFQIKQVNIKNWTLDEQTKFLKILKKDKLDLVLFFNHYKPIWYTRPYITLVWSLKDIYYMDFKSYFQKYKFLFLIWRNLKNSEEIICLDKSTKEELIEKFDIKEDKIKKINWFFPAIREKESVNIDEIEINIKTTYWILNDYIIYSDWDSIEKNYEKLIQVFAKLRDEWTNISLVFLWNEISFNLDLRNLIIDTKMQKNIHFLWSVWKTHKKYLYKNAKAIIFPSFYETFPFSLRDAVYYNSPIIASELPCIKNIFEDSIYYFSPLSVNSIYKSVKEFLKKWQKEKVDYSNIIDKYNQDKTTEALIKII